MSQVFPEENFQLAFKSGNLYSIAMIVNQLKQYTLSIDQVNSLLNIPYSNFSLKKTAVRILAEMYVEQTVSFSHLQTVELFHQYCLYYPRAKGGYVDRFFKLMKKEFDLDNITLESGKAWLKSYLLSRSAEFNLDWALASWAGVVCDSKSDKYIYAGVWEEGEEIVFRTFYGRIENTPQSTSKRWPARKLEEAIKHFNGYVREKESHGYSQVSLPIKTKEKKIEEIQEEKKEETLSGLSWDDLYRKTAPITGTPSSLLGSIVKALAFSEYRARSREDFPTIYSTPEDLEGSLLNEALGFLYSKFKGEILDCLRSKSKEEWLLSIGMIKKSLLSLDEKKLQELYKEKGEEFVQEKYQREFEQALELAKKSN